MKCRITAFLVFCVLVLLAIAHAVYYYPLLPAVMASHFDLEGQVNGWASKSEFMIAYASVVGIIGVLFVGLSLAIHKTPAWMINLPNKDYWLTPERQAVAYRWLSISMMWLGDVILACMIGIMQIIFLANLWPGWNPSTAFLVTIVLLLAVVLGWTGVCLYRFRLPKET